MSTQTCCENCIPVLAEDGTNEVSCAECGTVFVSTAEVEDLRTKAEQLENVLAFANNLKPLPGPTASGPTLHLKSVPEHPKMQEMAQSLLGNTVMILRQEIEHSPPDKRNRLSVAIFWEDEKWNLTLAKGDYDSLMEKQRDQAREERDYWMQRALGSVEQPVNNDHEQDGD